MTESECTLFSAGYSSKNKTRAIYFAPVKRHVYVRSVELQGSIAVQWKQRSTDRT